MAGVEVVLVTGRTMKQGMGVLEGKESDTYRRETGMAELSPGDMETLQVEEGDKVVIGTDFGEEVFQVRQGDLPDQVAFLPYGTRANILTGAGTEGSGMPAFKGLKAWVRRWQE